MQDKSLIDGIQRGEPSAFHDIVRRHQQAVYGHLRARLLRHPAAKAATQDVFLRFLEIRDRLATTEIVRARLFEIAAAVLREKAASKRSNGAAWGALCVELDSSPPLEGIPATDEAVNRVSECLAGMEPSARKAIELRYAANKRMAEIAIHLKRSESAARSLLHHARQALRRCVESRNPRPGP
jgi:RNA polymerase sigma-70 factor (ECF subfamily)